MGQVFSRGIGEKSTKSLRGFTKTLRQTFFSSSLVLHNVNDYFGRPFKIRQLLGKLPDLLRITDRLFVSISLDLGQLLHSICVMIHNIGQISHLVILS